MSNASASLSPRESESTLSKEAMPWQVKDECPSLIYAHLTAYGASGPEAYKVGSL